MSELLCPVCNDPLQIISCLPVIGKSIELYVATCPDHGWFRASYDNQSEIYDVEAVDNESEEGSDETANG